LTNVNKISNYGDCSIFELWDLGSSEFHPRNVCPYDVQVIHIYRSALGVYP